MRIKAIMLAILAGSFMGKAFSDTKTVDVAKDIAAIVSDRYANPVDFIEFSAKLQRLGVVREAYDLLANRLAFYSESKFITALTPPVDASKWEIGKQFDEKALIEAIAAVDLRKISAAEFHRLAAKSGVVLVSLHPAQRKIIYVGCEGSLYKETY